MLKNRSCIYQTAVNFSFYKHIAAVEQIAAILFMPLPLFVPEKRFEVMQIARYSGSLWYF
jgi:hypothetical protein